MHDDGVTVVNFFRTIRLPAGSIERAGFAKALLPGFAVPLVLVGDGVAVWASGVSAWTRSIPWRGQSYVQGKRNIGRAKELFRGSGIVFDPSQPMQPTSIVGR